jgi:hypothetical protein
MTGKVMSIFAKARNIRHRSAKRALAAGVLAWLGLLLQPCVMAASFDGTPDDANSVQLSIVVHHGPGIPAEQCLHCDDSDSLSPVNCDDIVASSSFSSPKSADTGADGGKASAPAATVSEIQRTAFEPGWIPQAEHLPPPVAFTEAYCVYLE